jgi:hypothetical protein
MFGCLFLLRDRTEHVARTRNMRQINLGLDLFFAMSGGTGRSVSRRRSFAMRAEALAHQFCFMLLERTGVRFFLGNTDLSEHVKYRFALDLQLTGQIIDSNLHQFPCCFIPRSTPRWLVITLSTSKATNRSPLITNHEQQITRFDEPRALDPGIAPDSP